MIRKAGFIFLLGGFLWLLVDCTLLAPMTLRSRVETKIEALREITLTPETANSALKSLVLEQQKHLSRQLIPAAFMLAGGLTLAVAPTRKKTGG